MNMNVISMQRSQRILLAAIIVVTIIIIYVGYSHWSSTVQPADRGERSKIKFTVSSVHVEAKQKLSMADLSPAWNVQPDFVKQDYSWARNLSEYTTPPLIPHIIHQIWDTADVPLMYIKWIETWTQKHPGWQHWFWTLNDIRQLVVHHYIDYLTLYDSYESSVFRADAGRYFILHRYGGVYVDLDMDAVRPIDPWTWYASCLISEENYEHVFVVREQKSTNVMNGFIAAAPRHPFLDFVIKSLDDAARHYFGDYLYATGPGFFDAALHRYNAHPPTTDSARVTVLPPIYFLPTFDPSESDVISGKCFPTRMRSLPDKAQIMCRKLAKRSFHNDIDPMAYANHHWIHAYMFDDAWKKRDAKNVFNAVSAVKSAVGGSRNFE